MENINQLYTQALVFIETQDESAFEDLLKHQVGKKDKQTLKILYAIAIVLLGKKMWPWWSIVLCELTLESDDLEIRSQARLTRAILYHHQGESPKALFELKKLIPKEGEITSLYATALDAMHWILYDLKDSIQIQKNAERRIEVTAELFKKTEDIEEKRHWQERAKVAFDVLLPQKQNSLKLKFKDVLI
jgi:hypothetical protein